MTSGNQNSGFWSTWKPWKGVPEYNILLLGETGAGKSTTVNAFANYLKYGSFEDAKQNEFVQVIPSRFTLPDPETGDPFVIQSGDEKDENERPGMGASSTQSPSTYLFKFKDRLLRLIDTPGMGDTNGVNVDRENFDKILAHLHNFKQLHGILILIKSTETRKTAFFRYCITELLAHLHKSACENLVFCFTFSRNSFYGPGEGYNTLRNFLNNELSDIEFQLEPGKNCFFIDNEAYRFLVAKKKGFPFRSNQEAPFLESWTQSVEQSNAMWDRIISCKPHDLLNTVSLNNARKFILEMAQPMVMLQSQIETNVTNIKEQEKLLRNYTGNKVELAKNLEMEIEDIQMSDLPYPRTTCTSMKCIELVNFQGNKKACYTKQCHPHCGLTGVAVNTVGHPILKGCAAMQGKPNCVGCGCPWEKHMHIRVEYITVKKTIENVNKKIEIRSAEDAADAIESAIEQMQLLSSELENELIVIQDVCSKFAYVLNENSNTPYNRFIEPYLELLMDEEQKKLDCIPNYSGDKFQSLKRMKAAHKESIKFLKEAIEHRKVDKISLKDIYKFKDQLASLKQTGKQFKQMMDSATNIKHKAAAEMKEKELDLTRVAGTNVANKGDDERKGFWQQFWIFG